MSPVEVAHHGWTGLYPGSAIAGRRGHHHHHMMNSAGCCLSPPSSMLGECSSSEDASSSSMTTFNLLTAATDAKLQAKRFRQYQEERRHGGAVGRGCGMSGGMDDTDDMEEEEEEMMVGEEDDGEGEGGTEGLPAPPKQLLITVPTVSSEHPAAAAPLATHDTGVSVVPGKSLPTDVPGGQAAAAAKRRHHRTARTAAALQRTPLQRMAPPASSSSSSFKEPQVDVRMIDFAHTTFGTRRGSVPGNGTVHHGPDCGFLTGLDSLRRLLLEIISDEEEEEDL